MNTLSRWSKIHGPKNNKYMVVWENNNNNNNSCLFSNGQRTIFSHFKSLRLLTMTLIKNMEFNNHLWHACYVPRTMPKNMAPSLHQPTVYWGRQTRWVLNTLLSLWELTELTFILPTQCSLWLTNTASWFPLPLSTSLKIVCCRF